MPQKFKRLIGITLMVIFALYYANICFFYHGHIINGVTIVHSHFYGKGHVQTGTHSVSELTLISALSVFQSCAAILAFAGLGVFLSPKNIFFIFFEKKIVSRNIFYCSLRAPPVSI